MFNTHTYDWNDKKHHTIHAKITFRHEEYHTIKFLKHETCFTSNLTHYHSI